MNCCKNKTNWTKEKKREIGMKKHGIKRIGLKNNDKSDQKKATNHKIKKISKINKKSKKKNMAYKLTINHSNLKKKQ